MTALKYYTIKMKVLIFLNIDWEYRTTHYIDNIDGIH